MAKSAKLYNYIISRLSLFLLYVTLYDRELFELLELCFDRLIETALNRRQKRSRMGSKLLLSTVKDIIVCGGVGENKSMMGFINR